MKKRIIALLLAGLLLISLAACAKPAQTPAPAPVPAPAPTEPARSETLLPELTGAATCAMSTFMNEGLYRMDGNMLYGMHQTEDGKPCFGVVAVGNKNGFPSFEFPTVLVPDCTPKYLCFDRDYFFFTDNGTRLLRMDRQTRALTTLYGDACAFLQLVGDRLYFTDREERLVCTDRNGEDLQVISQRATRYPYVLGDCILFQDVEDHESLHVYFPADGSAVKLNDEPSYLPTLCGKYLYYTVHGQGDAYRLCRMDLSTEERSVERGANDMSRYFAVDAGLIYAVNGACWPTEYWTSVVDSSAQYGIVNRTWYVSEEYTVAFDYKPDGSIEYKWLTLNASGGGKHF